MEQLHQRAYAGNAAPHIYSARNRYSVRMVIWAPPDSRIPCRHKAAQGTPGEDGAWRPRRSSPERIAALWGKTQASRTSMEPGAQTSLAPNLSSRHPTFSLSVRHGGARNAGRVWGAISRRRNETGRVAGRITPDPVVSQAAPPGGGYSPLPSNRRKAVLPTVVLHVFAVCSGNGGEGGRGAAPGADNVGRGDAYLFVRHREGGTPGRRGRGGYDA